jgi:hypothetical protein
MSRLAHAAAAGLALAVLLGSLALPLASLARDEPAPFCCSRGRCCCAGEPADEGSGRPCLRAACRCGKPEAIVLAPPLRIEAVLPAAVLFATAALATLRAGAVAQVPLTRADDPPVPPPRRPLPA